MPSRNNPSEYVDLDGNVISLEALDAQERELLAVIRCRASTDDWPTFEVFWLNTLIQFYRERGLSNKAVVQTAAYRVSSDLCSRLAASSGGVRPTDYRDQLFDIIRTRFRSRHEFCQATGLSDDMVSHVLAGRKHLSIDSLSNALTKVGFVLRIVPHPDAFLKANAHREAANSVTPRSALRQ